MRREYGTTIFWLPAILFGLVALARSAPLNSYESGESSLNNGTQQGPSKGSEYSNFVHNQREWNLGGGNRRLAASNSSSPTVRNGTFFLGLNATEECLGQTSCILSLRDKKQRLWDIRNHVLQSLGMGKAPSMGERRGTSAERPVKHQKETNFSGKIQTFYASCEIPANVDKDVWNTPEYFHLYFDFNEDSNGTNSTTGGNNGSLPVIAESSRESSSVSSEMPANQKTTISAKLRLFKIGTPQVQPEAVNVPASNATDGINGTTFAFVGESLPLVEEKIVVSVLWYRSPVTKHHYKKKILDTKILSVKESKWVEFDIINAAVYWLDRKETNFGLVIQVVNEDNELLDPSQYFVNIPCADTDNGSEPIVNPPSVEICSLSTPQSSREVESRVESPSIYHIPMGQSLNHLSRVAKAHAKNNNRYAQSLSPSSNFPLTVSGPAEWQNDQLLDDNTVVTSTPSPRLGGHKRRHGHGGRVNKNNKGFQGLDEDHPLRSILATVSSNVSSRERTRSRHSERRHQDQHNYHHLSAVFDNKEERSGEEDSGERDIIIQKIYITSPNQHDERER